MATLDLTNGSLLLHQTLPPSEKAEIFSAMPNLTSEFLSSSQQMALMEDDCVFQPTVENYVMIVSFCIIFCLAVIGNSVVVVVILQVYLSKNY
jgi:hypothetical protein